MIFAIGDLHLGSQVDKPMSIFGPDWQTHQLNIQEDWTQKVSQEDAVLIPGDISWAMTLDEALPDLKWIDSLPGHKYFVRGNHDYWWRGIKRLNQLSPTLHFIQNSHITYRNVAICGTRGWMIPGLNGFVAEDRRIYHREAERLRMSLESARRAGVDRIVGMLHFPPTSEKKECTTFTQLFEEYGVTSVCYGHLHGEDSRMIGSLGWVRGIHYQLVSCDFLNFRLHLLDGSV